MKFCNRCMARLEAETVCPHCGHDLKEKQDIPHALRPGTVLNGKYLIGNVLGQGGFGITYVGFDLALEIKIAVKEHFVLSSASRAGVNSQEVYWSSAPENMNHFLTEARRMAMLEHMPEIAHVRDVFYENNTAYIIMEYVEGQNLESYLRKHGTMSYDRVVALMLPVIEALDRVHEKNLVHRDISPDNLMMEPGGTLRVLDLGAAGDLSRNNGQASQLVARHGFSPYEQYIETGKIGPWTDVYAVCATIYYCCTGKRIPNAYVRVDRLMKTGDGGIPMDPALSETAAAVLQQGLAVETGNRIPNMQELGRMLKESLEEKGPASVGKKKAKSSGWKKGLLAAGVLGLVLGAAALILFRPEPTEEEPQLQQETTAPTGQTVQTERNTAVILEIQPKLELKEVEPGCREDISVLSGPERSSIRWSVEDPLVAKISGEGEITAVGFGSTVVTAEYEGQTVTCKVEVTLKGNVQCTYESSASGLTVTGFQGELPANLILPDHIDGKAVTRIGNDAFRDCAGLVSVVIPNTVQRIGQYAFSDCTGMTAISIPDSVQTIENDAFYGCSGLKTVTLPDSITTLEENAFSYCTGLTSVKLPNRLGVLERGVLCGCKKLTELIIPESVSMIREGAFRYCTGLTEVVIPERVKEIGSSAFRDCTNLKGVALSDNVVTIGEAAFSGCTALEEIRLPEKLEYIRSNAFSGCISLTDVIFPDRKILIETEAFSECGELKTVTISNDCELLYGAFPSLCTIKFY